MSYNLSNLTNQTDMYGFFVETAKLTDGLFGNLFLITMFFILFVAMKNYKSEDAAAAASFTTAIFSYIFLSMGIVGLLTIFVWSAMLLVSVFLLLKRD